MCATDHRMEEKNKSAKRAAENKELIVFIRMGKCVILSIFFFGLLCQMTEYENNKTREIWNIVQFEKYIP